MYMEKIIKKLLKSDGYKLRNDIIASAKVRNIDPFETPFLPGNGDSRNQNHQNYSLKLKSSDYGSFADHVDFHETLSAKWGDDIVLTIVEKEGDFFWYLLLTDNQIIEKNTKLNQ